MSSCREACARLLTTAFLVTIFLLQNASPSSAAALRVRSSARSSSSSAGADAAAGERAPTAEVAKVLGMMESLVKEINAEQASDEEKAEAFTAWCGQKKESTSQSITELQTRLQELEASLSSLAAQKDTLVADVSRLTGEIDTTQGQIDVATEKRTEENQAFQLEQADFDGSIAACGRATEILAQHYGEPAKEAERPAWMGLAEVAKIISKQVMQSKHALSPAVLALIQQRESADPYQSSAGEAGGIVEEMTALADTFKGDKQSALEDEKRLAGLYQKLMGEKNTLLTNLKAERDDQQSVLNGVNRDLSESETAKMNADNELQDQQKFLANTEEMCHNTSELFEMRSEDRKAERTALAAAIQVLSGAAGNPEAPASFLQRRVLSTTQSRLFSRRSAARDRKGQACPMCKKAAALLASASRTLQSQTLASAASTASGNEMVQQVIAQLENLMQRIDQDLKMQAQHKAWCETELSEAVEKSQHHQSLVEQLTQEIADSTEVVAEKQGAVGDTNKALGRIDENFQEMTTIHEQEREDFDVEHKNYVDSIAALNEATDILAKFYGDIKKSSSLLQSTAGHQESLLLRQDPAPSTFEGVYEQKGGRGVVEMIQSIRGEFEKGKSDLEGAEKQAHTDYQTTREAYEAARGALIQQLNRITVELQTAQANIEQSKEDKLANEAVVTKTQAYKGQIGSSCEPLLKDFEERVKMRNSEKKALEDACTILKQQ